jgi:TetR/AcrR family transcriptional repressor of nem operon
MAGAGLTHGGFYAHFASKEALIAEALRSAQGAGAGHLRPIHAEGGAPPSERATLAAMVARYLSPEHRDDTGSGCLVAALGAEARRHSPEARSEIAQRGRLLAQAFLPHLPSGKPGARQARATAIAATLVGGLILARLEPDPAASERVLEACRRFVLQVIADADTAGADRMESD